MSLCHKIIICLVAVWSCVAAEEGDRAAALFDAGLYDQAEPLYLKELQQPDSDASHIRLQLGQLYIATQQYPKVLEILNDIEDPWAIYLKAVAHARLQQDEKALDLFHQYLKSSDPSSYKEETLFEMALIHFQQKKYMESLKELTAIHTSNTRLQFLVNIYRARISLAQHRYQEAITTLSPLAKKVPEEDPLHFEVNALLGEAYFLSHEYAQAIPYLKKSSPPTVAREIFLVLPFPLSTGMLLHPHPSNGIGRICVEKAPQHIEK